MVTDYAMTGRFRVGRGRVCPFVVISWKYSMIRRRPRRPRLKALRAQHLELYSLSGHHQIGDDVLREVLGELDLSEANLGPVK